MMFQGEIVVFTPICKFDELGAGESNFEVDCICMNVYFLCVHVQALIRGLKSFACRRWAQDIIIGVEMNHSHFTRGFVHGSPEQSR